MANIVFKSLFIAILIVAFSSCQHHKASHINILKKDKITWKNKEACTIIYSDGNKETQLNGKIKFRGGTSSKYSKHSYTLELENDFSMGDLPKDDDWIINAGYIDKTFMRHKICYDLYRLMDKKNASPRCAYTTVSYNNEYNGLYVLMEKVNASMLKVDKSDSMAMVFKEPLMFYEAKDRHKHVQDTNNFHHQKYPKLSKSDKSYFIENFTDFLYNSSDTDFAKNIHQWVDIENTIDWHLLLLYTNNGDGILKNFYLYKIDKNTPLRFAIWDYDHSFGRDGDNEKNMMERPLQCKKAILLKRLMEIPELNYNKMLAERWKELRKSGVFSMESFEEHIQNNHEVIKEHLEMNFKKWPVNYKWYYDANNYEQELQIMRDFVKLRIPQLDERFGLENN